MPIHPVTILALYYNKGYMKINVDKACHLIDILEKRR
jgi:hypothetical protein